MQVQDWFKEKGCSRKVSSGRMHALLRNVMSNDVRLIMDMRSEICNVMFPNPVRANGRPSAVQRDPAVCSDDIIASLEKSDKDVGGLVRRICQSSWAGINERSL